MPGRKIRVLELRFPISQDMIKRQTEFLIGVRFRVVLIDPAWEAGADKFRVLGDDGPIGVVFDLRIDEGHLLRTGDALVSVKYSLCWLPSRKQLGCLGVDCARIG